MSSVLDRPPIIRGDHVFLRPSERADLPLFVRWFNDAEVLRNLAMHAPMSAAGEAAWFDRMLAAQGTSDYHFVICLLTDGRPIGTTGLHGTDLHNGSAEFGIAIGEKAEWSKGLLRGEWSALPHRPIWAYDSGQAPAVSANQVGLMTDG